MRLAEIDMDRAEALEDALHRYQEAYTDYMALIDKYPPAHREIWQMDEISKAMGRCTIAKMHWENANAMRYRL